MPDDAARCTRCGWEAANFAPKAAHIQEQGQAAAAGECSRSSRMRVLAAVLASPLFFLFSCTGGVRFACAVATAIEDRSEQVPFDEANPPKYSVAIVATPVGAPPSAGFIYWSVRDPERDLAKFRLKYPGYGFLPPSDRGEVNESHLETQVSYQVLKRDAGKALVKTHSHHYPFLFTLDVRATYEATDSDSRLISYRAGSDTVWGFWAGTMLAVFLAVFGEVLLGRIAKSEVQSDRRNVGLWAKALAKTKGNVRKAESRYIAMRVKQLKRIGDASNETPPSPPA